MQRKIDEAAQWRSTKAPCGNVYWYSVVSSATAWDKPPVYAEVKSIEFNQRLNDLQIKWRAARSQGPAQPSPQSGAKPCFAVKSQSPAAAQWVAPPAAAHGQPDYSRLVLASKEDLKNAVATFHQLCASKSMSTHPNTSYHITFSRTCKEDEFPLYFHAMGLEILEEDANADKNLPYAEASFKNPAMPTIRLFFLGKTAAPDKLTFEWHRGERQIWVKGSRGIILDHIVVLLGFLGEVSDVGAQQSYSKVKTSAKKIPELSFGQLSVHEKIIESLGIRPAH